MRLRLKGINSSASPTAAADLLVGVEGRLSFVVSRARRSSSRATMAVAQKIARRRARCTVSLFPESAEFHFCISPAPPDYIAQIAHRAGLRRFSAHGSPTRALARSSWIGATSWQERSLRQADSRLRHAGADLCPGRTIAVLDRGGTGAPRGGKLCHVSGTRIDKIWDDEEVERFLRTAPPSLRLAMLLAINTGQRQGDLLRRRGALHDGQATIGAPAEDRRLCPDPGAPTR